MSETADSLLEVRDLSVRFSTEEGAVHAADAVSLAVNAGETVALVGESGCGKTATALALCRLNPEPPACYPSGRLLWKGTDTLRMDESALRRLRGGQIAYVFQEAASSLNPVFRVGAQIAEAMRLHGEGAVGGERLERLMRLVGMPAPRRALRAYPHELSGGMQQRAMIAMALACKPDLLVADEPTTALDVTIQSQILALLATLQIRLGMAVFLITHNLALVAGFARRVYVMYAGRVVEHGPAERVLGSPAHPYTRALLAAVPRLTHGNERMEGIPGRVPNPADLPPGCRFRPRCRASRAVCGRVEPELVAIEAGHEARCHFLKSTI